MTAKTPKHADWLLYGANGYTGEITARLAAERGWRPILGGRNAGAVEALAHELDLPWRAFALDEPGAVLAGLAGCRAVLHCAGPFSRTAAPMASGCLAVGAHYLDLTGEIAVIERLAARDAEARAAGILLLPAAGFDVVPSDCLAAHLARRLPGATRLTLGFQALGRTSHGTATTMVENAARGGAVRRGGCIVPVPAGWRTRTIDFGRGPRRAITLPWGDVATAWHSTGIPDIEVYVAATARVRWGLVALRAFGPLVARPLVQRWLKRRIDAAGPGPSAAARARGSSWLWGEVRDAAGRTAVSRLRGPEGYTWTALAALAIVERVLAGDAPAGFQTPSRAYGPDFVLTLDGVERYDEQQDERASRRLRNSRAERGDWKP